MKKGLLFLVGLLLLVLSVLIWVSDGRIAKAGSQTYAETYTVTEWRNAVVTGSPVYEIALGPSKWSITGSFGNANAACESGESCFTETWTANGWKDSAIVDTGDGGFGHAFTFENNLTPGSFSNVVNNSSSIPYIIAPSGVYGAIGQIIHQPDGSKSVMGIRSMPSGWTITGTVTTP